MQILKTTKMKKWFILIFLFLSFQAKASDEEVVKFEVIKRVAEYLQEDINKSTQKSDCEQQDYDCLIKYVGTVQQGEDRIKKWKALSLVHTDTIFKDLTEGNRVARKETQAYKDLVLDINALLASATGSASEQGNPSVSPTSSGERSGSYNSSGESSNILPVIALVLSGIALVLAVLSFLKSNKKPVNNPADSINNIYKMIDEKIVPLQNKLSQKLGNEYKEVVDVRLRELSEELNARVLQQQVLQQPQRRIERKEEQVPATTASFAKISDLGNGFSPDYFMDSQNGEQIFELTLGNNKGSFSVSSDSHAQKYVLNDYNRYLSNACEMRNQPAANCRIITVQPGIVVKSGSNWMIEKKAVIEFR